MILSLWMYTKYCIPIVLQITTWRRGFMEQIELVSLGVSHWLYVLTVVAIIISIVFRRDVIIPSIVGLFLVGFFAETPHLGFLNNFIFGVQVIFSGLLNAGKLLFDIMLIIAIMVALLSSLRQQGADRIMVRSEEHTSELQSRGHLVCRLLLEKKKQH